MSLNKIKEDCVKRVHIPMAKNENMIFDFITVMTQSNIFS